MMLARDEARVNGNAARDDLVIMIALAKAGPPHLTHEQPPTGTAISGHGSLQYDVAPNQALRWYAREGRAAVIEQYRGGAVLREQFFQRKERAPVTQRFARE